MLKNILQDIIDTKRQQGVPDFVIKNFLKEYLQYPVLEFIYNNKNYKNFIFTGGSCLRICFNGPRLSEDLDFDLNDNDYKKISLTKLAEELKDNFRQKFLIDIETRCQGKTRIYLKFPILKELGLANQGESDLLYVKIEPDKSLFKKPETELTPVSNFGFNMVIKNYSIEFLMTGKLNAIFTRQWLKGKDDEIDVKGRDFYDLFWYLDKKIKPNFENLKRLIDISDQDQLKKRLKDRIEKNITAQKLSYDLKNFFPDQNFVIDFCKNYKKIMERYL